MLVHEHTHTHLPVQFPWLPGDSIDPSLGRLSHFHTHVDRQLCVFTWMQTPSARTNTLWSKLLMNVKWIVRPVCPKRTNIPLKSFGVLSTLYTVLIVFDEAFESNIIKRLGLLPNLLSSRFPAAADFSISHSPWTVFFISICTHPLFVNSFSFPSFYHWAKRVICKQKGLWSKPLLSPKLSTSSIPASRLSQNGVKKKNQSK